jgi:uncharacterized repeat protein (TIGR03803 family)
MARGASHFGAVIGGRQRCLSHAARWLGVPVLLVLLLLSPGTQAQTFQSLSHFSLDGISPLTPLVEGPDGLLYGTTLYGGGWDGGTVFKVTTAGERTMLAGFEPNPDTGFVHARGLAVGSDGAIYGVTERGGLNDLGTVFRVTAAGELTTLVHFTGANGAYPTGLVLGPGGDLYGTTFSGGTTGDGTVFKLTLTGALTMLVEFTGNGAVNKGSGPFAALTLGSDGLFHGSTRYGGEHGHGTIFTMTAGGALTTLVNFTGASGVARGSSPAAPLVEGADGNFYGTTGYGGVYDAALGLELGTVFQVTPSGIVTTLMDTLRNAAGEAPGLVRGADDNFYGVTSNDGQFFRGTVFRITPDGVLTTMASFPRGENGKGGNPYAGMILASDGNFYGTAWEGMVGNNYGAVYRMTPAGEITYISTFYQASKGSWPAGGLRHGPNGHFFGLARFGGINEFGTAYEFTPGGDITLLSEFDPDTVYGGGNPDGRLLWALDGNFYGITTSGKGSIFRLTPAGVRTTRYAFDDGQSEIPTSGLYQTPDGSIFGTAAIGPDAAFESLPRHQGSVYQFTGSAENPIAFFGPGPYADFAFLMGDRPVGAVVQGPDGYLYGSTRDGGASNRGMLYKVHPAGAWVGHAILAEFTGTSGPTKGAAPLGEMMQGADGNLYGMTSQGGAYNRGTIFRVTPEGVLTTLVEFTGNGAVNKGDYPNGGLIIGADGNFYGVTTRGGAYDMGTAFRMTPSGVLDTIHEFNGDDGEFPTGTLATDATGTLLYGVTEQGGRNASGVGGGGSVFRIALPGSVVLQSITVTPENASVAAGLTQPFSATGHYSDGSSADLTSTATWQSSVGTVASVTNAGLAQGLTAGSTTISASQDGVSGSASLTVTAPVLQWITITPATASITPGQTQQFTATGTYSDDSTADLTDTAMWQSSNPGVATVNTSGLAMGIAAGTATITATQDGKSGSATLTVIVRMLVSISVTPSSASVFVGWTQQFTATGTYSDGSTANLTSIVMWKSNRKKVATVNSSGLATGVAAGTVTITAKQGRISGTAILAVEP